MKKKKPRILVIGLGGVIGAKPIKGTWKYGEIPQNELLKLTPQINETFEIESSNILRVDSVDLKPENWLTIANYIYYKMKNFDGVVVTMGIDTLPYVAAAISFLIQKTRIPIVFTGSQLDPIKSNTDARSNLCEAITVAGKSDIAETIVVINKKIFRATEIRRNNASEFDAFDSKCGPIGKIQGVIKFTRPYTKKGKQKSIFYNTLNTNVTIIKLFPGFNPKSIRNAITDSTKGIILEGYGLGTLPFLGGEMQKNLKFAYQKKIPIIITSDCFLGEFWETIYNAELLERFKGKKIIQGYDLLTEVACVKLMWALGQTNDYQEIKKLMQTNYCGEISKLK